MTAADNGQLNGGRPDGGQPNRGQPDAGTLGDADARALILERLDRNLFVEAGAGSGKTRSLVDRIVRLIEVDGVDVGRIAAITFTEAAARELRTRVRDALLARAAETGNPSLETAAGGVESAAFTTLHGFALRLLADHPVEAGLPPGFDVADELVSLLDFDEAWRLFVGRVGDDMALFDLQERSEVLNVALPPFIGVARQLDDNWDRLDPGWARPLQQSPDLKPLTDLEPTIERLRALTEYRHLALDQTDKLYEALVILDNQLDSLVGLQGVERLQRFTQLDLPVSNRGRAPAWPADPGAAVIKAEVKDCRAEFADLVAAFKADVTDHYAALVVGFVLDRVRNRRRRGELSFHDLLVLCRRLLRSDEAVRLRLHQRYSRILLDEFQDTDPIQIELAVLLAVTEPVGDRSWEELAAVIPPGRLTVVGDPKQSIYRFRRADIETYARTEDHLSSESVALTTNFRSVPGIVEWVNDLFGQAMGQGEPARQPAYRALGCHRPGHPDHDRPVRVFGGPVEAATNHIRSLEADDVAGAICRLMEEEWPVWDDGRWRPPRLDDVAILIPSRLSLPALESSLSAAAIPFRPETSSLVYATQEVTDVLATIRAVVDPASAVDVVAALRSAVFAVSDDDLVDWFEAGGSWDYRRPGPGEEPAVDDTGTDPAAVARALGGPIVDAFETLHQWHRRRWWIDPATMVDTVVRERRLREEALFDARPRDRWRRYRFLAEQAREFSESQGGDLHDFVRWAEIQSSDLARITEPIPAEPDDEAVRILTVHGSKGLEFPIVILAGAPTVEGNRTGKPTALFTDDGDQRRLEVKTSVDAVTAGFEAQSSIEQIMDVHERIRLHYVAATRARDHLVASAYFKDTTKPRASMGRRTWMATAGRADDDEGDAPQTGRSWQVLEPDAGSVLGARRPTQLRLSDDDFADEARRWKAEQATVLTQAARRRQLSPTALVELKEGIRPLSTEPVGDGATALLRRSSGSGAAFGSAVHQVLERIDLSGRVEATAGDRSRRVEAGSRAEQIEVAARVAADDHGIAERSDEVADRVHRALAGPTLAEVAQSRHWKELSVAVPWGDGVLEGSVDLCYETNSQSPSGPDDQAGGEQPEPDLIVVDYKTDALDPADPERSVDDKVARYRVQVAAYAVALEQLTGRRVRECRLLFLAEDSVHERTIDATSLSDARSEVQAMLDSELGTETVLQPAHGVGP